MEYGITSTQGNNIELSSDLLNQLTAAYGFVYYCYYTMGSAYHQFDVN